VKHFRPQARPKKSSLVAGRNAIMDAMREGKALDRIYINNKINNDSLKEIKSLASQNNIPINYVPAEKLSVAPDCGLSQTARWAARQKLVNMVKGAKLVREKL